MKKKSFDFATYRSALNTLRAQVANISTRSLMEKKIHLVISKYIIVIDLDMKTFLLGLGFDEFHDSIRF